MTIQLLQGDCIELMKTLPDKSIDLTVTSPPYDNLRNYNDSLMWNENIWQSVIKELFRVTKIGGVVVWIVGDATIKGSETGTSFKQALWAKDCGFNLHDTMIYQKNSLTYPDRIRYFQCFEYMFVFSRGAPKCCNQIKDKPNKQSGKRITGNCRRINGELKEMSGSKNKRHIKDFGVRWNIWKYNTGWKHSYSEDYLRGHPAIFPEKLANDHIISWSNEGDMVLDCFAGSGTTGVAAINTNRNAILIEREPEYCEIIKRRIAETETTTNNVFTGNNNDNKWLVRPTK